MKKQKKQKRPVMLKKTNKNIKTKPKPYEYGITDDCGCPTVEAWEYINDQTLD